MSDEVERVEVVEERIYVGRREEGGKVYYVYSVGEGQEKYYNAQPVPGATIGSVFAVTTIPSAGTFIAKGPKGPRYLRRADVPVERIAEWVGKDAAAGAERARKAAITKASREKPLEEILAPLRAAAVTMSRGERRALAVMVLGALGL